MARYEDKHESKAHSGGSQHGGSSQTGTHTHDDASSEEKTVTAKSNVAVAEDGDAELLVASSNMIGDMRTVITNGPNAATLARAAVPAGPIGDYTGNNKSLLLKLREAANMVTQLLGVTNAGDIPNFNNLTAVLDTLTGAGGANTPTIISTMQLVITQGPNPTTKAQAVAPAGPIMDYVGNCRLALLLLKEAANLSLGQVAVTDASDAANLTLLQNIKDTLV